MSTCINKSNPGSRRIPTITLCTIFLLALNSSGMSYATGHKHDFSAVFEGLGSPDLDVLHKNISKGMDKEFVETVRNAFPDVKLVGNHRHLGHWGFQGSIPFNKEPYKTALADYPKEELVKLWKEFTDKLTREAMQATGLPRAQAKAYVGLLYNIHLLGDLGPGNKVLNPLPSVEIIIRDIEKNLHHLFGNRSKFAAQIIKELRNIPLDDPKKAAVLVRQILVKYEIGEKLFSIFSKQMKDAGVTFSPSSATKAIRKVMESFKKQLSGINPSADEASNLVRVGKTVSKQSRSATAGARLGVFQKLHLKGKEVFALSVPVDPELAFKLGIGTGVLTFFFTGGATVCKYFKGTINQADFNRETSRNLAESLASGSAIYVVVAFGICPAGWGVIAIGAGAAIITNLAFDYLYNEFQGETFSLDDFIGSLPTAIQNRQTAWQFDGLKSMFDFNERQKYAYDMPSRQSVFDQQQKEHLFIYDQERKTIFDAGK